MADDTTTVDGGDVRALAPNTLRLERRLPGPIDRVWAYLVDDELRGTWLARGPLEGSVGGRVTLRFRHAELSPEHEEVPERYRAMAESGHELHGTVTAFEPPHRLSFTWDDAHEGSEVTFELREEGGDVLLTLTHRRLDGRAAMVSVSGGWHTHVDILRLRLEGRQPPPFWGAHAAVEPRYERLLADLPERVAPEGAPVLLAAGDGRPLLRFVRAFAVPRERLWRAVSEPEGLDAWYPAELRTEGRVGGWVRERFPGAEVELPAGTLLAFDPPERFAYELAADPGSTEPSVRHPQTIDMHVLATPDGSVLRFDHVYGDRAMTAELATGWHTCLASLARSVAGEPPPAPEGRAAGAPSGTDASGLRSAYEAWFAEAA